MRLGHDGEDSPGCSRRLESLRTALREYLLALDRGDDLTVRLIERAELPQQRAGSSLTLVIPLVAAKQARRVTEVAG